MSENQETTKICDYILQVGSSMDNTKHVTVTDPFIYICPASISKSNWLGGLTYSDEFSLTQSGTSLTVRRTDESGGWGMDLQVKCCKDGKNAMVQFNQKVKQIQYNFLITHTELLIR